MTTEEVEEAMEERQEERREERREERKLALSWRGRSVRLMPPSEVVDALRDDDMVKTLQVVFLNGGNETFSVELRSTLS
jgi:hypothetical protein